MLEKGPFSKCYWFLSEHGKHTAKNDIKAPSASVRQMPSLLLTVRSVELSFLPKCCPWDNSAFCSWVTQWSRWVHPQVLPLLGVLCPCRHVVPWLFASCCSCTRVASPWGSAHLKSAVVLSLERDYPCWSPFPLTSCFFTKKKVHWVVARSSPVLSSGADGTHCPTPVV